ncbi:hypothetical protein IPM62_02375 [Candidatus Woesebacteria bacterium]|nr:MAG: hypothetical protein IPM62_02375 [Candidatus Woesebacteria bacterium]
METLSQSRSQSWLSWFYRGVLILGFLILVGRLFDLQIIRGAYFRSLAEGNRIRRVPITAARGEILARGGELLVGNTKVKKHVTFSPTEGYEKTLDINNAPDEEIIDEYVRDYKLGSSFAHVSGYLGLVNEDEVGKVNAGCLSHGPRKFDSLTGRTGLEQYYECTLMGHDGEELVEVDVLGNRVRTLGRKQPISGREIRTTIDYGLQIHVADIFSGKKDFARGDIPEGLIKGAVVISDTKGEILALYSSPSYDPNIFVKKDKSQDIENLFTNTELPLYNRATGGTYHPGSVFKPVVVLASLETRTIDDDYTYEDTGSIVLNTDYGVYTYNNWYWTQYGGQEGVIGIKKALARSTDTLFYKIGELTGIDNLVLWAEKFGFGVPTGIDLPGEVSGLLPNPEWKKLAKAERWFLGNTYHFSIGQGDTALTPIQINRAIAAIAADGKICKPHLVGGVECSDLEIDKDNLEIVREGMFQACSPEGTGFTFFDINGSNDEKFANKKVACKTGTAETSTDKNPHAWFTFFTPFSTDENTELIKPEIVVTVLVEEGGEGSKIAGPIARSIYNYWYNFPESKPASVPVATE